MDIQALVTELTQEEGERLKLYKDTVGKWTIGIGRNLEDQGISKDEEAYLLANDIKVAMTDLDTHAPWWCDLSEARQQGLCDMCFNIGWPRLAGFHNMLLALQSGDWQVAHDEALDSVWARQVGHRAQIIANKFLQG